MVGGLDSFLRWQARDQVRDLAGLRRSDKRWAHSRQTEPRTPRLSACLRPRRRHRLERVEAGRLSERRNSKRRWDEHWSELWSKLRTNLRKTQPNLNILKRILCRRSRNLEKMFLLLMIFQHLDPLLIKERVLIEETSRLEDYALNQVTHYKLNNQGTRKL